MRETNPGRRGQDGLETDIALRALRAHLHHELLAGVTPFPTTAPEKIFVSRLRLRSA